MINLSNYYSKTFSVWALGAYSCLSAYCQEFNCYCYENEQNSYVEWLCLSEDSAFVAAKMTGYCEEGLDFQRMLELMRSNDMIWGLTRTKEHVIFTKIVSINAGIQIMHNYLCVEQTSELAVELSYFPDHLQYKSLGGPPIRTYKKWTLEDIVPLQQLIRME